jgi:hypothetical protein
MGLGDGGRGISLDSLVLERHQTVLGRDTFKLCCGGIGVVGDAAGACGSCVCRIHTVCTRTWRSRTETCSCMRVYPHACRPYRSARNTAAVLHTRSSDQYYCAPHCSMILTAVTCGRSCLDCCCIVVFYELFAVSTLAPVLDYAHYLCR